MLKMEVIYSSDILVNCTRIYVFTSKKTIAS
jgi:hypothetical protein